MQELNKIEKEISQEEIKKLLPRNIYTLQVQITRLKKCLKSINPKIGNFLFTDLIGRIVWQACATSNSIIILAKNYNDHGIRACLKL